VTVLYAYKTLKTSAIGGILRRLSG